MEVKLDIPEKLAPLLDPYRYKILRGGRGSSKSWSVARWLILRAMQDKERILCCREIQRSIRDSVHRLIGDQIQLMGVGSYFEVTRDEIRCVSTGSMFVFAGLATNTVESIKSFEGVTKCWIEEGQTVSEKSLGLLIPTIFRTHGSEIIVTMNPVHDDDPAYVRFIKKQHSLENIVVIEINADDNPWFPPLLRDEMERLKKADYDEYCHVWLGQTRRRSNDVVFDPSKLHLEDFEPKVGWVPLHGVDWGYSSDPTVLLKGWMDEANHAIYIEQEVIQFQCEIDMIPVWFDSVPGAKDAIIRADNSRPEMINYCKRAGFKRMMAAKKWRSCAMDGVDYIRSLYDIYIHTQCPYTYWELKSLRYHVDSYTGNVLQDLAADSRRNVVTDHGDTINCKDDALDSLRYAIEPYILGHKQRIPERLDPEMVDMLGNPMRRLPESLARENFIALTNPNAWMV